MTARRIEVLVDTGISLPGEGALRQAVGIVPSRKPSGDVLFCLPGGGMNRGYWDLMPADGDDSFSFARQMAERGFTTVFIDHLGVGGSSRPQDGYQLTVEVLAEANANVVGEILHRLQQGTAHESLAPMTNVRAFGIGHSMGSLVTIVQQARFPQYAGIAVLGFTTRGLEAFLSKEVKGMGEAERRRSVVSLARAMFRENYPVLGRSGDATLYSGKTAEAAGVEAIKAARDVLLPVPAFHSMLPNNVAEEAAAINVPVFVGVGERDMTGPAQGIPGAFTHSPATTLHVLPGAGHSHFLFPSRNGLFDALAEWAAGVPLPSHK